MNFLRESVFRVGGAIVFGAGLVGAAFFVEKNAAADEAARVPALVVARGDVRTVQPARDTDKDGLPDWEETLRGTDPQRYTTADELAPPAATTSEPYTPPTTLTGRFAERFLENIIRTGAGEPLTEEGKAKVVSESLGTLAAQTRERLYTRADIKSTAENDVAALHTYGNRLGATLMENSVDSENELVIFNRAVKENNVEKLAALRPIEEVYANMISDLRALDTPSSFAKQHVDLINTIAMVKADIVAMQRVFSDPLSTLMRVKRYQGDAAGVYYAIHNIRATLEKSGIAYASDEPGIFLFSLRP